MPKAIRRLQFSFGDDAELRDSVRPCVAAGREHTHSRRGTPHAGHMSESLRTASGVEIASGAMVGSTATRREITPTEEGAASAEAS